MKDLRSQLTARFGDPTPASTPAQVAQDADPLGPRAHLDTPWLAELRACAHHARGIDVPPAPSLNAARQLTDRIGKVLKTSGRKRERKDLLAARQKYLSGREKLAWSRVKSRFSELGLSQRSYRSLKQEKSDPEKILARLAKTDESRLRGMGHAAIRDLLG